MATSSYVRARKKKEGAKDLEETKRLKTESPEKRYQSHDAMYSNFWRSLSQLAHCPVAFLQLQFQLLIDISIHQHLHTKLTTIKGMHVGLNVQRTHPLVLPMHARGPFLRIYITSKTLNGLGVIGCYVSA